MTFSLIQTLVLLLAIAALAGLAARVIGIPYPVLLVLVGLGLALAVGVLGGWLLRMSGNLTGTP